MPTELMLHGVGVRRKSGRLVAGPIYCPTYWVKGTTDKVMIDDEAYTGDTDNEAAKIALMRRVDTELNDLVWTQKVAEVSLQGVMSRKGRVGMFDVLFVAGPTFDLGRRSDDQVIAARARAGQPTGLPGDRKLIVPVPTTGTPGDRMLE
jgi:hypothetical protein